MIISDIKLDLIWSNLQAKFQEMQIRQGGMYKA